ncbi:hypothetical protein [Nocardioides sp.]|uniref:hypothetical protein n=1 Tax=Nocardioides sp. TaxID=35761 RepID=UPI002B273057|nr:hypothetical protein [Nocardioides sp.]
MSNRQRPRNQRQSRTRKPADVPRDPVAGMEPWLWAMLDADTAESRGDAVGALKAVERRPLAPDGTPFWRPSRIVRLGQLLYLGPAAPRWAISRWILAQALQHLSQTDRGRAARTRTRRAVRIVTDLHGRTPLPEPGHKEVDDDEWTRIVDHDWVYRQVHLFELGGLDAFLADGASADLVAGADRVHEWVNAPMGGFTYLGASGATLLWLDQASLATVETPNVGSAFHLLPGSTAIGRLVPAGGGVMFESAPLEVPRALACAVAADPEHWLDRLRDSAKAGGCLTRAERPTWTGLMSDVPLVLVDLVLGSFLGDPVPGGRHDPADRARAALLLVRETLEDLFADPGREHEWEDEDDEDDGDTRDDWDDDLGSWETWAIVHAVLVDPGVIAAIGDVVTPEDLALLREAYDLLAEPASTWVGRLLDERRGAA